MNEFWWSRRGQEYKDGHLVLGKGHASAAELAEEYGTPLYVMDANRIADNCGRIAEAMEWGRKQHKCTQEFRPHFSVKSNPNVALLGVIREDAGWQCLDVVSPGEAKLGIAAGYEPEDIMFTGTSVSDAVMRELLEIGAFVNIDSRSQLVRLNKIHPEAMEVSVRWNPGIGAGMHEGTITAGPDSHGRPIKFGIPEKYVIAMCETARHMGKDVAGLHQHMGSGWQGDDIYDFLKTVGRTLDMADAIAQTNGGLRFIDFGGGPGIRYKEGDREFDVRSYAWNIWNEVKNHPVKFDYLEIEPGRYIVGDAGVLLLQVNTVEEKNGYLFVGCDGGFNVLIRPAMYDAYHEIVTCKKTDRIEDAVVIGHICETSDITTRPYVRRMMVPEEGDYLAVLCAGAYGVAMSSNYNSNHLPATVMLRNGDKHVIEERQTFEQMVGRQRRLNGSPLVA